MPAPAPEVPIAVLAQAETPKGDAKAEEVKAEVQPEVKAEVQPEVKAEIQPEVKTEIKAEVQPEVKTEVKAEVQPEVKAEVPEQVPEEKTAVVPESAEVKPEAKENNATPELQDWQQKEADLLKKIAELETVKKERTEESLKFELKVREDEIELLKARVQNLETELQAALSKPSGKNREMIENIKQQHEELLSKARGMIFDKTKMVKNQELQIEALTTQVKSLKDINQITKDLLEIRNSEVKAMEERYQAMDARYKAEKERHSLVLQRAQNSSNINEDLRKEYETQLAIFKELRTKYEERVQALNAENARLKTSLENANGAGPS